MRALIVDDEVHARRSLEAMLDRTGEFTVVGRCGNAVEALHAIRAEKPDVLFLDVQMPKVNGLQLLYLLAAMSIVLMVLMTVVFIEAFWKWYELLQVKRKVRDSHGEFVLVDVPE
jgi:two-component system, LytTR family, response regulator